MNKIIHYKILFHSLRTAILVIIGFLVYEILKIFENEWNKTYPNNELKYLGKRKLIHFIIIFIVDIIILSIIAFLLGDI